MGCNLQRGVLHPVVGCNRGLLHEMGLVREGGSFFQSGKNEGNENTGISGQDTITLFRSMPYFFIRFQTVTRFTPRIRAAWD